MSLKHKSSSYEPLHILFMSLENVLKIEFLINHHQSVSSDALIRMPYPYYFINRNKNFIQLPQSNLRP